MNALTLTANRVYAIPTPHIGVDGIDSPVHKDAQPRPHAVFLCVQSSFCRVMAGWIGRRLRLPVSLCRSVNPIQPATICLTAFGGGFSPTHKESAIMQKHTQVAPATPAVSVVNNQTVTTSLAVAEYFGKRHDDVLKKIRALQADCDPDFYLRNFAEVIAEYQNGKGGTQKAPAFNITKDGFTLLVMGFTGKQALQFKIAYINRFNELEKSLHNPLALTNGQHFIVAKDGVVIYHKPLSERTSHRYLQPRITSTPECKQAQALLASLQSLPNPGSGEIDYWQLRKALSTLIDHLDRHTPYKQVEPAVTLLRAAERMFVGMWTMIDESRFRVELVQNGVKEGGQLSEDRIQTLKNIKHILGLPLSVRVAY